MLHSIAMEGIGPARTMRIDLAPRLNLIAGDNGLGKSFLLDVAWWLLTRTWASAPIRPLAKRTLKPGERFQRPKASVTFTIDAARGTREYTLDYDWPKQEWKRVAGRPPSPGLVLYARVDGGFGVWDPARNYWREAPSVGVDDPERPASFLFDTEHVWNGLTAKDGRVVCQGLLHDWVEWQRSGDVDFRNLTAVLRHLSPPDGPMLEPGLPRRISLDDVRFVPTLKLPYGEVPIVHASAGMRRVVALGYLLVWAFREHRSACELLGQRPEKRIIFLIDEIEAHLHPRWQRAILPVVLDVATGLSANAKVQVLATTHSPFVPLSVETEVDTHDRLWDLDLVNAEASLSLRKWEVRGDAMAWATSNLFDLKSTRSREGEAAIQAIEDVMRRHAADPGSVTTRQIAAVDKQLAQALSAHDPIFARWHAFKKHRTTAVKP